MAFSSSRTFARPAVGDQLGAGAIAEPLDLAPVVRGELAEEVVARRSTSFSRTRSGRHVDVHDVER